MSNLDIVRKKLKYQVPLIQHLGVDLTGWDGDVVKSEAPLAPNLNTHGTAFGGSLYCVAAMTGWSVVHLTLMDAGYHPSVWVAEGQVEFLAPVTGMLKGEASLTAQARQALITTFEQQGRARVTVEVVIQEADKPAVTLSATYVAMQVEPTRSSADGVR